MRELRVAEVFFSIQGETSTVGIPTVFVRLTGCPLRCQYCDTEYAFKGGEWFSLTEVLDQVSAHNTRYVTVTGGEPLAQQACLNLLTQLCDRDYRVNLETSGALSVEHVDSRVIKTLDIKTPGSGEVAANLLSNLDYLTADDEIKFVICDHQDYLFAKEFIAEHKLTHRHAVFFSPSHEQLSAAELAKWILDDQLEVRLQVQLHKYLEIA